MNVQGYFLIIVFRSLLGKDETQKFLFAKSQMWFPHLEKTDAVGRRLKREQGTHSPKALTPPRSNDLGTASNTNLLSSKLEGM